MPLPSVHLLTCPGREASLRRTLASWRATDWPGAPRVHLDRAAERAGEEWGSTERWRRLPAAFAGMLRAARDFSRDASEWVLFLEDDVEFHPQLGSLVASWAVLDDPRCVLASLFNPSLTPDPAWPAESRAFVAAPATFLGAQAILLRRWALRRAVVFWEDTPGMQAQRLARMLAGSGPIWVHRPSLVQHVAEGSSWGARVQQALDFDPAWQPTAADAEG